MAICWSDLLSNEWSLDVCIDRPTVSLIMPYSCNGIRPTGHNVKQNHIACATLHLAALAHNASVYFTAYSEQSF